MGLTRAVIDDNFNLSFLDAFKLDLRHILHNRVPAHQCKIPHTNETCDRISHFLQEYEPLMQSADHVLIERQPIMGIKDVEGLIMVAQREKTILISPNSMHKFFGISKFSYEERKLQTEKIAEKYVGHMDSYKGLDRKHDIADSVCMCIFFVHRMKEKADKKSRRENIKRLPFDEFRL